MHHKAITNRINRLSQQLEKGKPRFSVIKQYPGESEESLHQRIDQVHQENLRQYGHPGLVAVIRNFSGMEVKDVPKP